MRRLLIEAIFFLLFCCSYLPRNSEATKIRKLFTIQESGTATAEISASPRLNSLEKELKTGNRAALESFWHEAIGKGAPLVEPIQGDAQNILVTFLWRSKDEARIVLMSEFGHNVRSRLLTRLLDTDIWYKTYRMRNDGRFLYQFSVNDPDFPFEGNAETKYPTNSQPDPLNPHRWGSTHSLVELPAAPPLTWSARQPDVPKGVVGQIKPDFKSSILNNERRIFIYKPPGFTSDGEPYPLVVVGTTYISTIPLPVMLDNLQAKGLISPTVVVFIDYPQGARDRELSCDPKYGDFLAKELVPSIRERLHATSDPSRTIIGGASISGFSAACVAFQHPEVFGNVLSQSGSFWWSPTGEVEDQWLLRQFAVSPNLPIRFYLSVGLLESGYAFRDGLISMLHANRHLRDVLQAKGYAVEYREVNGGHDPYNWQATLPDGLITLIGKKIPKVK